MKKIFPSWTVTVPIHIILVRGRMGLLISVPVASLSAGLAVSLLVALGACGVSPVQLIPQESTRLPLQSTGLQNSTALMDELQSY
jgi:hypothetical protein